MKLNPRKIVLSALLSLPSAVLRAMSGGRPVWRGGRTLDPRLQYLASAARRGPVVAAMTPEAMRAYARHGLAMTALPPPAGVSLEAQDIDGPGGRLPLRVYRPAAPAADVPVLVFAHLGGVAGSPDHAEGLCRLLAATTRGTVVSVDYRLAPEHRFPAGLDDFLAAWRWAADNAHRFGGARAAVGGESIGASFAAAACQAAKADDAAQPAYQLLICPLLDVAGEGPAMTAYADAWPLSKAELDSFHGQYFGPEANPADPRASPLRAADLTGLAPAIVVRAGFDPTGDQPLAYARRLIAAGVPTTFRAYDSLSHGFSVFAGVVPAAEAAVREIAALAAKAGEKPAA